jgi:hypothetical protein
VVECNVARRCIRMKKFLSILVLVTALMVSATAVSADPGDGDVEPTSVIL